MAGGWREGGFAGKAEKHKQDSLCRVEGGGLEMNTINTPTVPKYQNC